MKHPVILVGLHTVPYSNKEALRLVTIFKSGVYVFVNTKNGKIYVGSSIIMWNRICDYGQPAYQADHPNDPIVRALKKYGIEAFLIVVLEYTPTGDIPAARAREQVAIDLYKPEYNQLKVVGTSLGYKHTDESKALISAGKTGVPRSLESRFAQAATITGTGNHIFGKRLTDARKLELSNQAFQRHATRIHPRATPVIVLDLKTGFGTTYRSSRIAAAHVGVAGATLAKSLKLGTPLRNGCYVYTAFD